LNVTGESLRYTGVSTR